MAKAKVKLRVAVKLGDPVSGTSDGSTYIFCCKFPSFNMAIRVKGGSSVSLRVEPTTKEKFDTMNLKKFTTLGFGGGDGGKYASQHFKANGGPLAACGAYGAVIEQLNHLFAPAPMDRLAWNEVSSAGN